MSCLIETVHIFRIDINITVISKQIEDIVEKRIL